MSLNSRSFSSNITKTGTFPVILIHVAQIQGQKQTFRSQTSKDSGNVPTPFAWLAGIVSNANDQSGKVIRESPPVLPLNLCNTEKSFSRMAKSIVRNVTLPLARKNILSHNVR